MESVAGRLNSICDAEARTIEKAIMCLQHPLCGPGAQVCGVCAKSAGMAGDSCKMPPGTFKEDVHSASLSLASLCKLVEDYSSYAEGILRHDRLRTALLQLLAIVVRLDLVPPQVMQQSHGDADSAQQQQQPDEGRAGDLSHTPSNAALPRTSVPSCVLWALSVIIVLLQATNAPSRCTEVSSSSAAPTARRSGRAGLAATAARASDQVSLALELGCVLLRMHTLQCCSRQVAAVCAWMGGDDGEQQQRRADLAWEQEEHQQGQEQQRGGELEGDPEHGHGGEAAAESEQGYAGAGYASARRRTCEGQAEVLVAVWAMVRFTCELARLAHAALETLAHDGRTSTGAAAAAASSAQLADRRRLSRRFLLLLASSLRDSHLLEHCARAAVVAAVGGRLRGNASSACGEAAAGQGQGQGQQEGGMANGIKGLRGLLRDLTRAIGGVEGLQPLCDEAPAPASTVVRSALYRALNGPGIAHMALVLGWRALCTADGGPEYGMPASCIALPLEYESWRAGPQQFFTRELHIMAMVNALTNKPRPAGLVDARAALNARLLLLMRACDMAVASAVGYGSGSGGGSREEEGDGSRSQDGLMRVLAPGMLIDVSCDALLAGRNLLDACWGLLRAAEAQEAAGARPRRAAHVPVAGTAAIARLGPGEEASAGAGTAPALGGSREGALACNAGREPGATGGVAGAGKGPVEEAGGEAAAAEAQSVASGDSVRVGAGGEGARAGTAAAAQAAVAAAAGSGAAAVAGPGEAVTAVAADGPTAQGGRQPAQESSARRRKALSLAVLRAHEVGWWRRLCAVAAHVVPAAQQQLADAEETKAQEAMLAAWLGLESTGLPDPTEGPLPLAPPPRLAAALEGGLLPCLEGLMRAAAREPADSISGSGIATANASFVSEVVQRSCTIGDGGHRLFVLLGYGDVGQGMGLLSALGCLLQMQPCGGSSRQRNGAHHGGARLDLTFLAATIASRLLAMAVPNKPDLGASSSGSSTSCPAQAALSPAVPPPPGHCRLQYMLAHAVRQFMPPLSRFVCCSSGGGAGCGRGTQAQAHAAQLLQLVAGGAGTVLGMAIVLSVLQLRGSTRSGGSAAGFGGGDGGTGSGSGGDGGGRPAAVTQQPEALPLARFLFEDVGVEQVLAAVPRLVPHVPKTDVDLASSLTRFHADALCCIAAAFPDRVRQRVMESGGSNGRSSSSSDGGGGGGGGGDGFAGAAAVWRVGLLRRMVPELKRLHGENLAAAVEALVEVLQAWRDEEREGEGTGAVAELAELRGAVGRLGLGIEAVSESMARVLMGVLGAPAAPLSA